MLVKSLKNSRERYSRLATRPLRLAVAYGVSDPEAFVEADVRRKKKSETKVTIRDAYFSVRNESWTIRQQASIIVGASGERAMGSGLW